MWNTLLGIDIMGGASAPDNMPTQTNHNQSNIFTVLLVLYSIIVTIFLINVLYKNYKRNKNNDFYLEDYDDNDERE